MTYCKLCSKTTNNNKELCPICQKKRNAAEMVIKLQGKVNYKGILNNNVLYNLGYEDKYRRQNLLWILYETNLINKINNKEEYEWTNIQNIINFVKKYDKNNGQNFKIYADDFNRNIKKCQYCGKDIHDSKKKYKLCNDCSNNIKTLKNIKFINEFEDYINTDKLILETSKKDYQILGIIYDLLENDLLKKIDEKNYQKIPDKIENFLIEHEDLNKILNKRTKENNLKKLNINGINNINLKNNENNIIIPSNEEIFNEFFNKYIKISNEKENWISFDKLFELFYNYALKKYQKSIPQKGPDGYNKIINSKYSKNNKIKTKIVNSKILFNLKFETSLTNKENNIDFHLNNTKSTSNVDRIPITRIEDADFILSKYMDDNLKKLHRRPKAKDLTQIDIYHSFDEYLKKQNKIIEYDLFSNSFNSYLSNIKGIYKKRFGNKVFYNFKFKNTQIQECDHTHNENKKTIEKLESTINENDKDENIKKFFIPENLQKFLFDKHIKEIYDNEELNIVYNDIINEKDFKILLDSLNNSKEYINKLNISKITEKQYNINLEYKIRSEINLENIKKIPEDINHSSRIKENTISKKRSDKKIKTYSLKNHEYLKPGNVSYNLYNTLNSKILDVDKNITRYVLKKIITYSINKRFVDIIIRKSSLTISIYIPLSKVNDPENICGDMTKKGSWASGFTEFKIYNIEDIDYAMKLIIQSYEYIKKMNEGVKYD